MDILASFIIYWLPVIFVGVVFSAIYTVAINLYRVLIKW